MPVLEVPLPAIAIIIQVVTMIIVLIMLPKRFPLLIKIIMNHPDSHTEHHPHYFSEANLWNVSL